MSDVKGTLYLPILAGRLKGKKWALSAGGKVLRLMFSTYEPEQTRLFEQHVRPGSIFLDVGAHAGYYTLLSAVLAGTSGRIFSFEPNPRNYLSLERNIRINGLQNVTAIESAVSNANGYCFFETGTGSGTGHLAESGTSRVRTIRLDDFARDHDIRPDFIKIDVEGAELMVLEGARGLLADARPVLFLSTHGADVHRKCLDYLGALGYTMEPIVGDSVEATSELICLPTGN
jgi:FkbM family methyltransferase